MARPMDPSLNSLPPDVQTLLVQDYRSLRIVLQVGAAFVVEGVRNETEVLERIEITSLPDTFLVKRLCQDFETCASDPSCALHAIDAEISGNHYLFRYSGHGESLYRKFVHTRPYLGGDDGLNMLINDLPPIILRDRDEVLEIIAAGIALCQSVLTLHNAQTLHNGINPHTVLWNSGEVMLRDTCSTSAQIQNEDNTEFSESQAIWYNLVPYLSPESSNRTSRLADFRSDIYAVGCTLYELLIGRPPFLAPDVLSFIHRHLTVKPPDISKASTSLPPALGEILMKCLAKSPEARYSSVAGLLYDLDCVHKILSGNGDLSSFQIASLDDLMRFNVSGLLCGREVELHTLMDAWKHCCATKRAAVVSIKGDLGIGKTHLITEFVTKSNALFVTGAKYQQYGRASAYFALTTAIQTIVRQLLTYNQRDIRTWRTKLLKDPLLIGVMADLVPELKVLLGDLPAPEVSVQAGALESRRHTHAAFIYILSVFSNNHGLIFCQDDVQWAHQVDLDLIAEIASEVPSLLMILSRRPVEGDDFVNFALDSIQAHDVKVIHMNLAALTSEDVSALVSKSLRDQVSSELTALAQYVYKKTSGNAYLVSQLLQTLHRTKKIYFQVTDLKWRFNIKEIKDEELTDDIIDSIALEMRSLPPEIRALVVTAAAIGQEQFTPAILARALDCDSAITATQIDAAVDLNIFRAVKSIAAFQSAGPTTLAEECFSFLHDRTQESAYALFTEDEQLRLHYKITTNLLKQNAGEAAAAPMQTAFNFLMANQYNRCLPLLKTDELQAAVHYNILAGEAGLSSGNATAALYYHDAAEHISEKAQVSDAIRVKVRFGSLEAHLANNAYQDALSLLDKTYPNCYEQIDRTRCHIMRMKALIALGRLAEAISVGLSALEDLKYPVPATDEAAEIFAEKMEVALKHDENSIRELADRAPLVDPILIQVQEVLSILVLPIYMARPKFLAALCYLSVHITTGRGPSIQGAYPAMMLGAWLSSLEGRDNLIASRAYGDFALTLLERSDGLNALAPGMYHLYAGHIAVFHFPMSKVMEFEDLAIATGKALFNVEYTVFSLVEKPAFLAWDGRDLLQCYKELNATRNYVLSTKSAASNCFLAVHLHGVAMFAGVTSDAVDLCPSLVAEDVGLAIREGLSMTHAFMWELWQLWSFVLIRDVAQLRKTVQRCCVEYIGGVLGTHYAAIALFLSGMALLTMKWMRLPISTLENDIIDRSCRCLQTYAELAPTTFAAKSMFLEALYLRSEPHDQLELLDLYDRAIDEADRNGCAADQALFSESASRWLAKVSQVRSREYMQRSYAAYKTWHCTWKVKLLEAEFSWLQSAAEPSRRPSLQYSRSPVRTMHGSDAIPKPVSKIQAGHHRNSSIRVQSDSFNSQSRSMLDEVDGALEVSTGPNSVGHISLNENTNLSDLDIKTVLNASIQISQGMKAEEVFESLMKTVLLAAGADYGVLALYGLDDADNASLSIHTLADGDSVRLMTATPAFERPDLLPLSIVKSTLATQKPIIRNDSQDYIFDTSFAKDRYYLSRHEGLRSVLCMPIPSGDSEKPRGVLYLENNATSSAFTNQRLECLTLLCTQSAMTLSRAAIYHEMRAAKAQAEEATAQKSTFLANMSHEIRTPFNALLSCAIFLLDTSLTQIQKDYVLTIRDSATLTLSIIDSILDFSKVEQGMTDIVMGPFVLSDTIETAIQIVAQKASNTGVDLVYSRKHAEDALIGDSLHLRQAILNLLGNAVKFTKDGYVSITSSCKAILDDTHFMLSIVVQDTGIGISQKGITRLFQAFSQVDASINRSFGGSGLGLAISKKLIEMMGGSIWVESVEGEGSSFFINVPIEIDPAPGVNNSMEIKETEEIKKQGRLALVISRYHTTADALVDDLNAMGLNTDKNTEVLDADSIAKAARAKPYSILVVDLQVDGATDLITSLQKILPSAESHFNIIVLTNYGSSMPKGISSARIAGCLVKPIPKKKLMAAVSTALRKIGDQDDNKSLGETTEENTIHNMPQKGPQKQLRILLAEDNIINTKVAIQHLKRLGYTNVVHAKDGIEVLEHCQTASKKKQMFDLILMDIQMPRLDGIGATEELIRRYPTRTERPVIIALTANATSTDRERCQAVGMNAHLAKPIRSEDLLQTLNSISRRPSIEASEQEN